MWVESISTLVGAWLFFLLMNGPVLKLLWKKAEHRTAEELERVSRGLGRETALECFIFVPASAILLIMIKPFLMRSVPSLAILQTGTLPERIALNTTIGIASYSFPFGALRDRITNMIQAGFNTPAPPRTPRPRAPRAVAYKADASQLRIFGARRMSARECLADVVVGRAALRGRIVTESETRRSCGRLDSGMLSLRMTVLVVMAALFSNAQCYGNCVAADCAPVEHAPRDSCHHHNAPESGAPQDGGVCQHKYTTIAGPESGPGLVKAAPISTLFLSDLPLVPDMAAYATSLAPLSSHSGSPPLGDPRVSAGILRI